MINVLSSVGWYTSILKKYIKSWRRGNMIGSYVLESTICTSQPWCHQLQEICTWLSSGFTRNIWSIRIAAFTPMLSRQPSSGSWMNTTAVMMIGDWGRYAALRSMTWFKILPGFMRCFMKWSCSSAKNYVKVAFLTSFSQKWTVSTMAAKIQTMGNHFIKLQSFSKIGGINWSGMPWN